MTAVAGFAAALAVLHPSPALADDASIAGALAASATEARADWEKRLPELVDAVVKDPASPYALAALWRIESLIDECRGREIVEQRLGPVLAKGVADGELDETYRDLLAKRAWARGAWDEARAFDSDRGYVRRFAAVGPFGWPSGALVHRRFGPEDPVLDPKQTWEGVRRRVGWTPLEPNPDNGWIDPSARLRDIGSGVWYAVARVRSSGARSVALKAYCNDSFKVIVNGRDVITAERDQDDVPRSVWGDAALVEGWNRILVKVTGRSSFALKVCDPATGLPLDGIEEGDPLEGGPLPAAGPAPKRRSYRTPIDRVVGESVAEMMVDPARLTVAAYLADADRRRWTAFRLHEKATASASSPLGGEEPALAGNVHAWAGLFLADFQPLPAVQRKLRAKQALEAAVKAFPGHVAASVRLAEYENEDDHPDRAVKSLQELLEKQESVNGWMAIARISRQRGWDAESVDAATRALALMPDAPYAMQMLNDVDRRLGDYASVAERHRRMLEIDRSNRSAVQGLVQQHRAQGEHEQALSLLRELAARWPHETSWPRQAADVLFAMGREDEAVAAWRALEPRMPQDESLPRRIGEVLESRGDKAGALECYRRSLAIQPFQPSLWRATARVEGKEEDFAIGWEPNVDEVLASLPSTEELKKQHPKAVAVTVLDHTVCRIHPDGTARNYVHMVYKVLDEKGVEKYGDLPNMGESLLVRAILPDGQVMTPTGLHGREYNIEGLVPGTVLDQRFITNDDAGPKGFAGTKFYFQDFERNNPNPVLLSRFVVISPEGMRLDARKRNYAGDPTVETKDGWTVTVWEKRDMPIVEPERNMPENDEIFPLVDYEQLPTFDDAAWQLFSGRSDARGSPFIDDAVAKIVKPEMTDLEKIRAFHEFVNREITGEQMSGSGATAVLLEKSGSRDLLFEAFLRAARIPYRVGRALAWNGSGRDFADQDASAFDGRFLWLEPSSEEPIPFFMLGHHAPFGLVPKAYRGSDAFLLDTSGGRITRLPEGGPEIDDSATFTVRLGADPAVASVEGTIRRRDPNGYRLKRSLVETAEDDRRKFVEQQLAQWFASPKLESYEIPNLETRGVPLDLVVRGTMSTYVVQQGESWVVSLGFPDTSMSSRYVDKAERNYDLVANQRDDRVDVLTIDLGDAWNVRSLPQDHNAVHNVGTYSLTWRHDGRIVRVRRERHFRPARYRPDEYKQFVAWCKAIDDAEDRKLELEKR